MNERMPTCTQWAGIYDKISLAILDLEAIGGNKNHEIDDETPDKVMGVRSLLLDAIDRIEEEDLA